MRLEKITWCELHNAYNWDDQVKENTMVSRCSTHGEQEDAWGDVVGYSEDRRPLGRLRRSWEVTVDRRTIGWGDVDWILLAQDSGPCRSLADTTTNIRDQRKARNIFASWWVISFWRRTQRPQVCDLQLKQTTLKERNKLNCFMCPWYQNRKIQTSWARLWVKCSTESFRFIGLCNQCFIGVSTPVR